MRRIATAAALVAGLVVGAPAATAAPEPHVSGSGETSNGTKFNGEAKGTPASATGNFVIQYIERTRIKVDCVNVQGNRAAISGTFVDGPGMFGANRGGALIEDNGSGQKDAPDRVLSFLTFPGQLEPDCGFYRFMTIGSVPIAKGNFTVNGG